jgi:hypothetical protein
MPTLSVVISRFVDEYQPGFVECELTDAQGELHSFLEKVPVVTKENLWFSSSYPQPGAIPCTVEAEWKDEQGRLLCRVSTEQPFHVESTAGHSCFVVLASQVLS